MVMGLSDKNKYGLIIFLGFLGATFLLSYLLDNADRSEEVKLMIEACSDIKAHETLRAEEDFEQIMKVVSGHVHTYRNQSDTILAQAVAELHELSNEAEFRNLHTPLYHQKFADVLNRLAYLELEDAVYLVEKNQKDKAEGAIRRAEHYMYDALTFSQNPKHYEQLDLLYEIRNLNKRKPNSHNIELSLAMLKQQL